MNNTIKLNNGALVAAREVKGKMSSYTFANLTQAEAHADKWGGKVCKFRGGRVFSARRDEKNKPTPPAGGTSVPPTTL